MGDRTIPAAGQQFIDRNNNLVQFIALAAYETVNTEMAVYQALSGEYKIYVMPWIDFIKEMKPIAEQYQKVPSGVSEDYAGSSKRDELLKTAEKVTSEEENIKTERVWGEPSVQPSRPDISYERREAAGGVNPVLMEFLDAKNYEEKLNVLTGSRKYLNENILTHMALSVDCNIGEGDIEDKINNLIYCLKTHARFENRRLR